MRQEKIVESGGINVLLDKQALNNFTIEELDYSVFLRENGQECTDVWGYMLKDAVQSNDEVKINNLADNFSALIKRSNQNDIFQTQEISSNINEEGLKEKVLADPKIKELTSSKSIKNFIIVPKKLVNIVTG